MGSVALAPETMGLSIALGAGVGALFGLGAYLFGKINHHETKTDQQTPPPRRYTPPVPVVNKYLVTE